MTDWKNKTIAPSAMKEILGDFDHLMDKLGKVADSAPFLPFWAEKYNCRAFAAEFECVPQQSSSLSSSSQLREMGQSCHSDNSGPDVPGSLDDETREPESAGDRSSISKEEDEHEGDPGLLRGWSGGALGLAPRGSEYFDNPEHPTNKPGGTHC